MTILHVDNLPVRMKYLVKSALKSPRNKENHDKPTTLASNHRGPRSYLK